MTYAQLKTDIANWTERDDLSLKIPTFISLCEAEIRRDVRVRNQETAADLTIASGSADLPTGFIEIRRLYLDSANNYPLHYMSPEVLWDSAGISGSGEAYGYTIEGQTIKFLPESATGTAKLLYIKAFDALTDDTDTNWLLDNVYDIYLYGSLKHTYVYIEDNDNALKYDGLYKQSVEKLNRMDNWGRTGPNMQRYGGITP